MDKEKRAYYTILKVGARFYLPINLVTGRTKRMEEVPPSTMHWMWGFKSIEDYDFDYCARIA